MQTICTIQAASCSNGTRPDHSATQLNLTQLNSPTCRHARATGPLQRKLQCNGMRAATMHSSTKQATDPQRGCKKVTLYQCRLLHQKCKMFDRRVLLPSTTTCAVLAVTAASAQSYSYGNLDHDLHYTRRSQKQHKVTIKLLGQVAAHRHKPHYTSHHRSNNQAVHRHNPHYTSDTQGQPQNRRAVHRHKP